MKFLKDIATYIGILLGIFSSVYHLVQTVSKVRQMNILLSDLSISDPRLQTILIHHLPLLVGCIVLVAFLLRRIQRRPS